MTGSTISSTSAAITSLPTSIAPPGPKPSRPGPRAPAWPLGHKTSWDRPSCAVLRPEPLKWTVPVEFQFASSPKDRDLRKQVEEIAPAFRAHIDCEIGRRKVEGDRRDDV